MWRISYSTCLHTIKHIMQFISSSLHANIYISLQSNITLYPCIALPVFYPQEMLQKLPVFSEVSFVKNQSSSHCFCLNLHSSKMSILNFHPSKRTHSPISLSQRSFISQMLQSCQTSLQNLLEIC